MDNGPALSATSSRFGGMVESLLTQPGEHPAAHPSAPSSEQPVTVQELELLLLRLALPSPAADDCERIDRIRAMERAKHALAAAQARESADFEVSQLEEQARLGVPPSERGRGIGAQIALARGESSYRGSRHLGLAKALVHDLPETLAAMTRGEASEWRATIVARETAVLDAADRRAVDAAVGPRLAHLGDRQTEREVRAHVQRVDIAAAVKRARQAHDERRVTVRPAPDTMTFLTGLLPVRDGVAVYAALDAAAKAAAASGDPRTRGQVMADTLVERVTGHAVGRVPIEIQLVMTDRALLAEGEESAHVPGFGPVPADIARRWVAIATDTATEPGTEAVGRVWLRRLWADPASGQLVAMESSRRAFGGLLRRMIGVRDQTCRTPWCDAPIRNVDHVERHRDGGPTSLPNAQGLCEACNQAREAPGWRAEATDHSDGRHEVTVTTPTGHRYSSSSPPLRGEEAAPSASPHWPRAG